MRQSTENFTFFYVDLWTMDPEVDSRPALCSRTQRSAWFDNGYMRCVSLRGFLEDFTRFLREGLRRPFRSAEADHHGPAF